MLPKISTVTSWHYAITNALAQQRLEGGAVSDEVIADLERAERGEITLADCLKNTIARHTSQ
jgi:hypothetical protein